MVARPLDIGSNFDNILLDCSGEDDTSFDTLPRFSGEDELYRMIFYSFIYPTEDKFHCHVPIELTLIFAAHFYSLSNTGRRLRYPAWADMHYPGAGGIEVRRLYFAARGRQLATRINLVWALNLLVRWIFHYPSAGGSKAAS